jgi:hypothetical protein
MWRRGNGQGGRAPLERNWKKGVPGTGRPTKQWRYDSHSYRKVQAHAARPAPFGDLKKISSMAFLA